MNNAHSTCRTLDCDRPYQFLTELGPMCQHHTIEATANGHQVGIKLTSGWRPPTLHTDQPTPQPVGHDPHGPHQVNCVSCGARATVITTTGPHCSPHALHHYLATHPTGIPGGEPS